MYFKELLPLLTKAHENGQQAHAMTMLGAGLGAPISTDDIGLDKARAQTIKSLKGVMLVSETSSKAFMALNNLISTVIRGRERYGLQPRIQRRLGGGEFMQRLKFQPI